MSASTNATSALPRGTIKRFREYLNVKFKDSAKHENDACDGVHRYQQRTREYGDYLYHQDRDKFNVELADALGGTPEYADFLHAHSKRK